MTRDQMIAKYRALYDQYAGAGRSATTASVHRRAWDFAEMTTEVLRVLTDRTYTRPAETFLDLSRSDSHPDAGVFFRQAAEDALRI